MIAVVKGISGIKAENIIRLSERIHLDAEVKMYFREGDSFEVSKKDDGISVLYRNDRKLYRSVILASQLANDGNLDVIKQEEQFDTAGVMLDMSRGGVMRVERVKEYLEYMALAGLNSLMLYMEDTFEIEGKKYFGHMRGKYTHEDLKEIDRYAQKFGIEVIPCIQTLGHFNQYLAWNEASDIKDTDSVLLAGEEKTYEFIDKLIKSISECFASKKIHIGLDEACDLGTGRYLKKNGYRAELDIFNDHIKRVVEITNKYGLEPMIWSDMYFRIGSKTGGYYDLEAEIPAYVKDLIPQNTQVIYWDYYHYDKEMYSFMIDKHKEFSDNIAFAGGIWIWSGLLPDYTHTLKATKPALDVCKEKGIKDIYATIWGDDGCETDMRFSLPGLFLYGGEAYCRNFEIKDMDAQIRLLFGTDLDTLRDLSRACHPVGMSDDENSIGISVKQILYSDILYGLVDFDMCDEKFVRIYAELEKKFAKLSENEAYFKGLFKFAEVLCGIAALKIDTVMKLLSGYKNKDRELLSDVVKTLLPKLRSKYECLSELHYKLWHEEYSPFGFDTIDRRYGGVIARIKTAEKRVSEYLGGNIEILPELEEERLPFVGKRRGNAFYSYISSPYFDA